MKSLKWFCLIVCLLTVNMVHAASGWCGGETGVNATWNLDDEGLLTISGTGMMENYNSYIHAPWYGYRKSIKSLRIENGIRYIGCAAFYDCSALTNITISNTVNTIGSSAFEGCSALTNITIPNSVTRIFNWAFSDCSGLINITIPYTVTDIGNFAFSGCSALTNITIPKSVTNIGISVFEGCSALTNITIPESVTNIGESAFSGCSALTNIAIPKSVESIESSAFSGCSALTNIIIPESVTSIGNSAFSGCSALTSISIPNSVTSIGDRTFEGCYNLTSITNYSTIPQKITIDTFSKYGTLHVLKEASEAFANADYWKNFTIVGDIKYIIDSGECGENATWALDNEGLLIITGTGAMTDNGSYMQKSFKSVRIENGITNIGSGAFEGCSDLTNITIPNSVTTIGDNAFYNCSALTNITIPNSVTSIGHLAFYNCLSLTNITIPNSVTSINSAFVGCSALTNITIPNSVTSIGDYTFYNCSALTNITIPNSVTSIGHRAFHGCSGLTNITIPNSVTSIGVLAFHGCSGLTNITIPNSVTSIGVLAFYNCSALTNITIPNSVTVIGPDAFRACSGLTNITIPNSVTSIGDDAFIGCSALTNITIPNSVTSIGDRAFYGCNKLTSVTNYSTTPEKITYETFSTYGTLHVLKGCGEAYANAYYWKNFTIVEDADYSQQFLESVNVTINEGGNVTLAGKTYTNKGTYTFDVHKGDDVVFTITPTEHKYVKSITVDGTDVTDDYQNGKYTIKNISASHGVVVTFADATFTITFNTDGGTTVNPVTADYGTLVGAPNPPTKTGYKFTGWDREFPFRMPLENITVTALWEIQETSGKCGEYATWSLDEDGKLTIGGYGDMYNYGRNYDEGLAPWLTSYAKIKSIEISGGITAIGDNTFGLGGYTTATIDVSSIILPDGIKRIGKNAFNMCKSISSIIIPNSVTLIDDRAFLNLENLTSIELSNSLISIGRAAFSSTGIDNIELPNSLTSIGDDAFDYCENLSKIAIPCSVVSIGADAFYECINLKNITNYADQPQNITSDTFYGVTGATLHVKKGCKEIYSNADVWKNFTIVEDADDSQCIIGDANGDKNVSISDYSAIVSHILDNTPNNFAEKAADVNNDGNISVSDLSALVQIILYQNDPVSRAKAFSYIAPKASLYSDDGNFDANDEASVRVNLDSNMAVDGFQFDIVLPENIQLKDIQQGTCRHNGNGNCTFRYAILKNGNIRVLCSSTSNSTIQGADGGIVEISLVTNRDMNQDALYVQIVNGEVSSRGTAVKTEDFTIRLTSDYTTSVNLMSKNKKMMIYDLNGRLLKRDATASDFKSLPKGVYIVDGNKIVK